MEWWHWIIYGYSCAACFLMGCALMDVNYMSPTRWGNISSSFVAGLLWPVLAALLLIDWLTEDRK